MEKFLDCQQAGTYNKRVQLVTAMRAMYATKMWITSIFNKNGNSMKVITEPAT